MSAQGVEAVVDVRVALLSRAATLMRERATAASGRRWRVVGASNREPRRYAVDATGQRQSDNEANERHIASWDPAVATSVADWLEWHANDAASLIGADAYTADDLFTEVAPYRLALAVASTYLDQPRSS